MKLKYFSFKTTYRRITKASWLKYLEILKNPEKNEQDKFYIKNFRKEMKNSSFLITVTHKPTNISDKFTVNDLNHRELAEKVLVKVQQSRLNLKQIKKEHKQFDGVNYNTIGGVLEKPNLINSFAGKLTTNDPMKDKKPKSLSTKYVGIELEFNDDTGFGTRDIGNKLKDAGLSKYVCVTTDGSCGFEVRVLLDESNFEEPLRKIMKVITDMGFKGLRNAGTHVHLDMRNRDVKTVYKNMFYTQGFLRKFLTKDRRKNTFTKPNKYETFEDQLNVNDRYHSINVQSYSRHKTLEIRMHQGTLNPDELVPWIKLLTRIANYDKVLESKVLSFKQAQSQYQFDPDLSTVLRKRIVDLSKKNVLQGAS